jgi:hypothetical protein
VKGIFFLFCFAFISACGFDEDQSSSCKFDNFQGLGVASCQDLGSHHEATRMGLEAICEDEEGTYEEKACSPSKGSPGCINTVSVLNQKIKLISWFDVGMDVSPLESQSSEYCEEIIYKD